MSMGILGKKLGMTQIYDTEGQAVAVTVVLAGPCSVENEKQLLDAAFAVKKAGARILRGGAYKPRTSPYSFQLLSSSYRFLHQIS